MFKHCIKYIPSLIAIALSIIAIFYSCQANKIADEANENYRAVSKLDLKPNIELISFFKSDLNISSSFCITNAGVVEAALMEIYIITYRYLYDKQIIESASYGSGQGEYYFKDKLPPFERQCFIFYQHILDRKKPPFNENIFELRIIYRRPSDMAYFMESSFYFLGLDSQWVNENNGSLKPEIYDPMKEAVKQYSQKIKLDALKGFNDWLHPIESTIDK